MAASSCVHCQSTNFELKTGTIKNPANLTSITVHFIQCSNCGGVIGFVPNELIQQNNKALEE